MPSKSWRRIKPLLDILRGARPEVRYHQAIGQRGAPRRHKLSGGNGFGNCEIGTVRWNRQHAGSNRVISGMGIAGRGNDRRRILDWRQCFSRVYDDSCDDVERGRSPEAIEASINTTLRRCREGVDVAVSLPATANELKDTC